MLNPLGRIFRFAFHQLYTRFAFLYDKFSDIVSRGEWWTWTRAGIPFLRGTRILEIALGSGNLHLDLHNAGYLPIGADLSPNMLDLTQKKFAMRSGAIMPRLVQADAKQLPFPSEYFSSLMMTFPPGFTFDPMAMRELWRVLEVGGLLLWVDDPYLYARDLWSRVLNRSLNLSSVGANNGSEQVMQTLRAVDGGLLFEFFDWRVERVESAHSRVHVFVATKRA